MNCIYSNDFVKSTQGLAYRVQDDAKGILQTNFKPDGHRTYSDTVLFIHSIEESNDDFAHDLERFLHLVVRSK